MPELPEVEALRGFLSERLVGHTVARALPVAFHVLKTYDPPLSALTGRPVTATGRRGKFLVITLGDTTEPHDGPQARAAARTDVDAATDTGGSDAGGSDAGESDAGESDAGESDAATDTGESDAGATSDEELHLVVHLARAGWLRWHDRLPATPPRPGKGPLALRLELAGPEPAGFDLTEAGTQKRLAVYCVRDPDQVPGIARLGPDPFDEAFTPEVFAALLRGASRQLKGLLRDQSTIAGIGNAYSDEILHAARMSPFLRAAALTPEQSETLYHAMTDTLAKAVERSRGLAAGRLKAEKKSGLRVHGRAGLPCPVCGDTIREVSFSDSALQYCPTCQTAGKILADRRLSRLLR